MFSKQRRIATLLAVVVTCLACAASASASVAYIDGNEVWVATDDGSQRARLSAGEGDWRQVAQSDLGYIVGVSLATGSPAQLSRFTVWDPSGNAVRTGALGASLTGSMEYPLSLDLTPNAALIVYGFAEETFDPPTETKGFFVKNSADPAFAEPQRVTTARFPRLHGTRVIGSVNTLLAGIQNPGSTGSPAFTPWLDVSAITGELKRTDVPATGDAVAFQFRFLDGSSKIALAKQDFDVAPVFPSEFDCFIGGSSNAREPSWSQDGKLIAWQDDAGVKVGGRPINANDPCESSIAPVTISASGSFPSMGPFNVAAYISAHQPPILPLVNPTVTAPRSAKIAKFIKSGLAVKVLHPTGGNVTLTLAVKPKQVGKRGSKPVAIATAKGTLVGNQTKSLKLKFTKTGKKLKKQLKGDKAVLTVTVGGGTTTKSITLK